MASTSNFVLAYNKQDVVAGGALSNANLTPTTAGGGGTGTVTQLNQGTGITLTPSPITGVGTIANAGVTKIISGGSNVTLSPSSGLGDVTISVTATSSGVSSITGTSGITPSTLTTGAVTLGLAAITPTSVNGITLSGSGTPTLSVTGTSSISGSSSGTNTGDQTNITGNAGTATKLATGRTIAITGDLAYTSPSFDGSANVTAGGTLASIVTAAGPIGSSTTTPVITIDAKGRVTALSSATIASGSLPSGATTSQSLLYNTSTAAWYTEHFNVKAFGATGDGSTDDHLAVNNAIAALNAAGGGVLYFPYGTYKMTAAITNITVPCRVIGDGINASTINQTSTSDALVISTSQQCIVQDITLQCTSSYNALTITAPSGSFNSRSMVNNVNVGGTPAIGFNFNEAFAVVTNCTVTGTIGIKMQNLVNPDESAGMITQCQINTNGGTAIALYADGVQVIDNYFYDNNYAVEIFVNNTTGTLADFWITDNHIEYCLISAVHFNNTSSGSYLFNVLVSNNEIAWSPPAPATTTMSLVTQSGSSTTAGWLSDFTFVGNVTNTLYDGIHLPYAQRGSITGNTFQYSLNQCVYLGAGTNNIVTKANVFHDTTTPYMDYGSSNSTDYWVAKGANVTQQNSGGTGLSIPNNSETTVSWNRSIYNDGSFWSSSSPTLITVPYNVGITRVQLTASINWDPNATGYRQIKIKDNNGNTYGGNLIPGATTADFASDYNSTLTCMIDLASMSNPTSFYVTATQDSGGALNIRSSYGSFFCMEIKC